MKFPNYRYIAWYYDALAQFIFGNRLENSKRAHLHFIEENNKILIVGGGTGKLIEYIENIDRNVAVDFVEPTANMFFRAKRRLFSTIDAQFYQIPIQEFSGSGYDIIITNFFLDQFDEEEATTIVQHLKTKLNCGGRFIFSDFIKTENLRDQIISKVLFIFFRLLTRSSTNNFPPYEKIFLSSGFKKITSMKYGRNIEAATFTIY
jgi:ubiquinone/menaquinone biosynthesis C-methylase UbiE